MTAGIETVAADRWLYGVITGDVTLSAIIGTKAFSESVPTTQGGATVSPPFVLWTMVASSDLMTVDATRIWANMLYAVRLVMAVEGFAAMAAGAAALDAALHRGSGTNVNGIVYACVREDVFRMVEPRQEGSVLHHLGGRYRLYVQ